MTTASEFWGLGVDEWQAIGSVATAGAFLVAAAAVVIAFFQLRQARDATEAQLKQDRENAAKQLLQNQEAATRQLEQSRQAAQQQLAMDREAMDEQREQNRLAALDLSRPYVLLTIEISPISVHFLDLILENVGAGPAFDVSVTVEPPLRRAVETPGHELADARLFREPLSMIPPRYRLRTHFDSTIERSQAADGTVPDRHAVTINYHDGRGHKWEESSVLDVNISKGLLFTEQYGLHHVAKRLQEIRDLLKKPHALSTPVEVVAETRDEYLTRIRAEHDLRRARHEEFARRLEERRTAPEPPTPPNPEA